MKRFLSVMIIMMAVSGALLFAGEGELSGSDYVRLGKLSTVTGTLREIDEEWYLDADASVYPYTQYEVHLGNYEALFPSGLPLVSGKTAEVTGYIYENNISSVHIITGGKKAAFRKEDGTPLWAASGRGKNAALYPDAHLN